MEKTHYDILIEELRKIKSSIDDIDREMEKDRQQLQNLNVRLGAVENQLEEQRKATNQMAERVKNKVQDVVDGVVESTDNLSAQIEKKKMVVLREKSVSWWKKVFKGWR